MSEDDEILASAHDGFVQEAHEMLRQFEAGLLATESNPDDEEALNQPSELRTPSRGRRGFSGSRPSSALPMRSRA
jgi:chemotaxis protein histidine kinase CheA